MIKTSTLKEIVDTPEQKNQANTTKKEGLRNQVLKNILNYSKSLAVCDSDHIGKQTVTLN